MKRGLKRIIGAFLFILGAIILASSQSGITGDVIGDNVGGVGSILSLALIIAGIGLMVGGESLENQSNSGKDWYRQFSEIYPDSGMIPSDRESPEDAVYRKQVIDLIGKALSKLDPRQEEVIKYRFGLNKEEKKYTQREIAEKMNLSKARIHQIEAVALRKLRHPSIGRSLKKLLEN